MERKGPTMPKTAMPTRRMVPPPQQPQPPPPNQQQHQHQQSRAGTAPPSVPLSPGQVVAIVREARKKALLGDDSRGAADADADGLKPGITLDLIAKNIPTLPDEVIEILRNGVERLALSHNFLASLPVRFSQCTSLRYLAARNNAFEVFPLPLCDLLSLEFLDLGRNRLRELPPEISRLTSLKALALQDNQIERLPLSLADMTSLQRLRLSGNPITFPPKEVLQVQPRDVPPNEILSESEVVELMVTDQIKRFLGQRQTAQAAESVPETEAGVEYESSEGADTPRIANRRATGRFPIRVKGSEIIPSPPISRSPSLSRPPIPGRSHFRGPSQFSNASTRKNGIIPLTMGKSSESLRSNSELPGFLQDDQRPESRSSRRGGPASGGDIPSQTALAPLSDPKMNRFSSHLRGFSYSGALTLTNPFSPEDPSLQRPLYVRELAALPVRRYESRAVDPVLEVARGILYSIFQIHLGVQTLMSVTNDGSARRSSLEMVFYNTNVYFEELEQAIQDYDLASGTRGVAREHEGMQRAYTTLIHAYVHICSRLISSVDLLVDNGDQRYLRSFLMLVYHSIMELRVAISGWLASKGPSYSPPARDPDYIPIPPKSRSRASSNAKETPRTRETSRIRDTSTTRMETMRPIPLSAKKFRAAPKTQMQVRTDLPYPANGTPHRTTTAIGPGVSSSSGGSSDSFTSAVSSAPSPAKPRPPPTATTTTTTPAATETPFERFYLSLKTTVDLITNLLPPLTAHFHRVPANASPAVEKLLSKSSIVNTAATRVQNSLSSLRLRDPRLTARNHPFWDMCHALFRAWFELGDAVREALMRRMMAMPGEAVVEGLKGVSRSARESMALMVAARRAAVAGGGSSGVGSQGSMVSVRERWVGVELPVTPQSAALGPAVMATRGMSGEP
ncbi:RAM signaling pathway protein-domain-containing protein [Podospora conica]|nr:RAM signaling pathway protein-domain-containing protein [Schizothecium conicum]